MTSPPEPFADAASGLDPRRLAISTLVAALGITGAAAAAGAFLRAPVTELGAGFIATLGGIGVAIGYFVPDSLSVPIPNDVFGLLALSGGMPFVEVVLWGTLGSLAGGSTGWAIGRWFAGTARWERWRRRFGPELALVETWRAPALAAAAITPLPYSVACWACGALRMPYRTFLAVSTLRVLRVAGYLALVRWGFGLA